MGRAMSVVNDVASHISLEILVCGNDDEWSRCISAFHDSWGVNGQTIPLSTISKTLKSRRT